MTNKSELPTQQDWSLWLCPACGRQNGFTSSGQCYKCGHVNPHSIFTQILEQVEKLGYPKEWVETILKPSMGTDSTSKESL
jgi:hypothetical protein